MRVVVVLKAQTAQEMQFPTRGAASESVRVGITDLQSVEQELGVSLTPMYPGQTHPTLLPYYFIDVPDQATADKVVTRLSQSAVVEAAYSQPNAELPGPP